MPSIEVVAQNQEVRAYYFLEGSRVLEQEFNLPNLRPPFQVLEYEDHDIFRDGPLVVLKVGLDFVPRDPDSKGIEKHLVGVKLRKRCLGVFILRISISLEKHLFMIILPHASLGSYFALESTSHLRR